MIVIQDFPHHFFKLIQIISLIKILKFRMKGIFQGYAWKGQKPAASLFR